MKDTKPRHTLKWIAKLWKQSTLHEWPCNYLNEMQKCTLDETNSHTGKKGDVLIRTHKMTQ